jgi:hypothetical protein
MTPHQWVKEYLRLEQCFQPVVGVPLLVREVIYELSFFFHSSNFYMLIDLINCFKRTEIRRKIL